MFTSRAPPYRRYAKAIRDSGDKGRKQSGTVPEGRVVGEPGRGGHGADGRGGEDELARPQRQAAGRPGASGQFRHLAGSRSPNRFLSNDAALLVGGGGLGGRQRGERVAKKLVLSVLGPRRVRRILGIFNFQGWRMGDLLVSHHSSRWKKMASFWDRRRPWVKD